MSDGDKPKVTSLWLSGPPKPTPKSDKTKPYAYTLELYVDAETPYDALVQFMNAKTQMLPYVNHCEDLNCIRELGVDGRGDISLDDIKKE